MSFKFRIAVLAVLCAVFFAGNIPAYAQKGQKITAANAAKLAQSARLGRGTVEDAAYSTDGKSIVAVSSIGVWIYDTQKLDTDKEPTYIATEKSMKKLAISSTGKTFAGNVGTVIYFWDAAGKELGKFDTKTDASILTFSPDGTILAVGTYGKVLLLDAVGFKQNAELKLPGYVYALKFSKDGKLLFVGGGDSTVRIYDSAGKESGTFKVESSDVRALVLTSDGTVLASAGYNKNVQLWDAKKFTELAKIELKDASSVTALAFTPDNKQLAIGGSDYKVYFSPLKTGAITGGSTVKASTIKALEYSKDGKELLIVGSTPVGAITRWDVTTDKPIAAALGHTEDMRIVNFSPDSSILAFGGGSRFFWFWQTSSGAEITGATAVGDILGATSVNRTSAAISPDGKFAIALTGFEGEVYDPKTGKLIRKLATGGGLSSSVAISPDSTLAAIASSDGLRVFDVESGKMLVKLTTHTDWLESIAFSPDQTMIASAADDATVRVWMVK